MKNFNKKIIFFIFLLTILISRNTFASTILLKPSTTQISIGEQFYVDVMINPYGKTINGIEGTIAYDSAKIKFDHPEESGSQISLWIERPRVNDTGDQIEFGGIIPNGFSGVIDPFNQKEKLPGQVIRLIFEGKESGIFNIGTANFYITLNDGLGTMDKIDSENLILKVNTNIDKIIYKSKNITSPTLTAEVVKNENLNNNKYTLIFEAHDEGSGIKEIIIKEGNRNWKKAESPYLLIDQSRNSIIMLQATNFVGQSIVLNIERLPYDFYKPLNIFLLIILMLVLYFLIKKIYEKNKNETI